MNANTNPTTRVLESEYAQQRAAERFDEIINQLERFKGEVKIYADRYAEAVDNDERAKVVNWTKAAKTADHARSNTWAVLTSWRGVQTQVSCFRANA